MIQALLSGFIGIFMLIGSWLGLSQPTMQVPLAPIKAATSTDSTGSVPTSDAAKPAAAEIAAQTSQPVPSVPSASAPAATPSTEQTAAALPAGSAWMTTLPLGDLDYVTSGPKKGYIYLCNVMQGGEGAQETGSWIHGSTWTPSEKIAVEGSISWPNATYSMSISGATRLIASNDLPTDRTTGIFPIQSSDPAYQVDRNPNTITAQDLSFSLPAYPSAASSPNCIYGSVGIMNNGVELFDGFDAEYRDAVAHEEQDSNQGHPDEADVYHYHGFTDSLKSMPVSKVVGFAFDGYPITGPLLPDGNYLTTSDLDECHGITSSIMLDGKSVSTYHYVLTEDFPYSVSCFHGKSYEPKPGGGAQQGQSQNQTSVQTQGPQAGQQGGSPPAPPQAAISACTGKSSGAACTVSGGPSGTCATMGTSFACKPTQ